MTRFVRSWSRGLLRAWARTARAPGYCYQVMERWGGQLAELEPLIALLPNGNRVECDLRDHVQRHMYFQGAYEPVEAFLFTRLAQPGFTVVDAGANVGQYSLLASSAVGPTGSVHSFEPVPRNFTRLRRHIDLNRVTNAKLNPVALWHEPGELRFGLPTHEANDGSYSVGAVTNSTVSVVTATATRLDTYAREKGLARIDLIKMDIEGAEWAALRGMTEMLARDRPPILMEINRDACSRLSYDPAVFWEFLVTRFGYTAWKIGLSARNWSQLPGPDGITQANVLFTPGGLPAQVASGWDMKSCLRWARSGRARN